MIITRVYRCEQLLCKLDKKKVTKVFRKMRRDDKKLDIEESIDILNKSEFGVLSTISSYGYPYGVPLNYAVREGHIYFHTAVEGYKLENIKNNDKVSFCVVSNIELLSSKFDTNYKSVIVFGKAKEVLGQEKIDGLKAIVNKYSKDYPKEGEKYIKVASEKVKVIRIDIEHVTGKGQE